MTIEMHSRSLVDEGLAMRNYRECGTTEKSQQDVVFEGCYTASRLGHSVMQKACKDLVMDIEIDFFVSQT